MQDFLIRQATNLLQLTEPKLNILIYHRVMPEPDPLRPWEIDANRFRLHMQWIRNVFNVIPLPKAIDQLKTGTLKRRSLSITFDDGYLDNATVALPILKELGYHATFFCTSAWLDGSPMWNDQVIEAIRAWPENSISIEELDFFELPLTTLEDKNNAIDMVLTKLKYIEHAKRQEITCRLASKIHCLPRLMMNPEHILHLKDQGMEIGGHSHSHPILANLNDIELSEEINKNKSILESIVGTQLVFFAYPNGKPNIDFRDDQTHQIVNAGYESALTTEAGTASSRSDLLRLPRFTPWQKSRSRFLAGLAFTGM